MSRFQLSLNVEDVEASVQFYTKLFGVEPAKHRPGYANFVVADPPLKLIVIEKEGAPGSINHVGIEFGSGERVAEETRRIADLGLPVEVDEPHTCCFATQEKAWTQDEDQIPWELYTVTEDTAHFGASPRGGTPLDFLLPPVSVEELEAAVADPDIVVIDAQGPGGYDAAHIDGALDFRLDDVEAQASAAIVSKGQRVIVYCSDVDCLGSEFIGTQLVDAGYTNVGRYPEGIEGWVDSGRPASVGAASVGSTTTS